MNIPSWLHLVEQLGPLALAATPLAPAVPFIILGIKTAEQLEGATGPQKLEIAKQIVSVGVAGANAQAGHNILDPALTDKAIASGISAVVDAVNLVHSTPVKVVVPDSAPSK